MYFLYLISCFPLYSRGYYGTARPRGCLKRKVLEGTTDTHLKGNLILNVFLLQVVVFLLVDVRTFSVLSLQLKKLRCHKDAIVVCCLSATNPAVVTR